MEQVWRYEVLIEIVITDYLPGVDRTARNSSPPPSLRVLAAGNKYPKMHALICNFHWSRSQKYIKNLQLHIRVLHACREYAWELTLPLNLVLGRRRISSF
jgi:hypothetical protein